MSTHPEWAAPGSPVIVRRRLHGYTVHEYRDTVLRHTPTLIVLAGGDRFRRSPWETVYRMTPRYLHYDTTLAPDDSEGHPQ
jgi:hypothetical protein